ncbi:response regulator [Xylophilus rhododendri]|uniref:histidine kinase n=1 Tax=Xylophilus rhododendri TaxID=2697032 RepID=A0A857J276_9BURK|nr:response regulator [Xylophilus rhododendri]QHI97826.1 response regulator [Xylophilus rhododendri]
MPAPAIPLPHLPTSGPLAPLLRDFDWAGSGFGAPQAWSEHLRTTACMVFDAPQPMRLAWGPRRLMLYNQAYAEILGRRHPAAFGQPMDRIWPEAWDVVGPALDRVFQGEGLHEHDVPFRTERNGSAELIHVSYLYLPVRDATGAVEGALCVCTETTVQVDARQAQRKLADSLEQRVEQRSRELAHTEAQLRQSQKMEAIGQLTGGIAHDFNNMLQGIVMPLQLIQRKAQAGDADGVARYVSAGLASAQRAAALTQRLLAFSRRQPLDSRPTDLAHALSGLHAMLDSTVGENVALSLEIPPDLWWATTDLHQFENAVLNLAINGRDAMPDGGSLHILAENVQLTPRAVGGVAGLPPGDYVRVVVRDSGVGMAADVLIKAFDPFFTTKPLGQGTGLGLSMIYGYARQSGGYVAMDSEVGAGTVVRLYLPRSPELGDAAEPAGSDASQPPERLHGAHAAVLVVEDDDTVRQLVVELLEGHGLQVTQAASGGEGMRQLAGGQRFDLLLTDVGLPGPNGRQLADFAQDTHPGIRVVLMTGYAEQASMRAQFLGDTMELLVKPFGAEQLLAKVHSALARRITPD